MASPEAAEQWADAAVVNNHFDTDGVLSIWTLLDPEQAVACRELLVAAAEAGDFDEWPALDRGLWLDAAIRAGPGAADDAAAYQTVLPQLPDLVHRLDERRDLWGREWDALLAAVAALEQGRLRAEVHGALGLLIHAPDNPRLPARCWPGGSSRAPPAICLPLRATGAGSTTVTSAPITHGPIPWSVPSCPSRTPVCWPRHWGQRGLPKVCRA